MKVKEEDYLAHYGILRRSGRYPWGSGGTIYTRSKRFFDVIEDLKKQGMSDTEIARGFSRPDAKFTTTDLRALKSIARNQIKQHDINMAQRLHDRGLSNIAIGERMGINESSVRSLLAPGQKEKADILKATSDMLRRQVDEKGAIDIGTQVERDLPIADNPATAIGISSTKFNTAVAVLKQEGYKVHSVKVPQIGTGLLTDNKVLARPDVQWKDLIRDPSLIKPIQEHSPDGGRTYIGLRPVTNVSSKRIHVVYKDEGGADKDGLIELRPGVKDLDMGGARYAQVRIAVDGTHFLKGMAIYNPDLPAGTDIRFNTNKSKTQNKHDAMKEMERDVNGKIDPKNPFGSAIKEGGQRGALNIIKEQGDWNNFRKNLPSQMLSKQDPRLAKTQLDLQQDRRRRELDEVKALTNPAIKRKLLETFADEVDSSAVHLEAAPRVGQTTKVLIPIETMKPNEIYAPSLKNGERVSLVRFPHGGRFEIPELTVNNRNPQAKKVLGNQAIDAVGIHHKVAERLSGADFDGDDVLVIPNNRGEVKSAPPLSGLKDFDPRSAYPAYDGMRTVDGGRYNAKTGKVEYKTPPNKGNMQKQMGDVSNLITDMTIKGAPNSDLERAVRHSMVVIDSEKHALDIAGSKEANGIIQLKRKYQLKPDGRPGGAATLLSRATGPTHIPLRKPRPAAEGGPIDKKTGKKVFVETGETYVDRHGKTVVRKFETPRLAVTDNAHTLVSDPKPGTPMERLYADHSNRLKSMANEARKEMVNTKSIPQSQSAKKVYKDQVDSLEAKLSIAEKNAPLERQAQRLARAVVNQKKAANPNLDSDDIKKIGNQALAEMRYRTGAKKKRIELTQDEWNAIQAGAISNHKLERILNNADLETFRKLATPRDHPKMSSAKTNRAKAMLSRGFTQAEVADALGVGLTTLKLSLEEG